VKEVSLVLAGGSISMVSFVDLSRFSVSSVTSFPLFSVLAGGSISMVSFVDLSRFPVSSVTSFPLFSVPGVPPMPFNC